jgi:hypothetical protein
MTIARTSASEGLAVTDRQSWSIPSIEEDKLI